MTLDFPPNDDRLMPDNEFHDESLTDDLAAVNSNNPSISENIEDKMTGNEEEKARS